MKVDLNPEACYREKQVLAHFIPVSRATWWRWVKSGHAPRPIRLGERIKVWRGADLDNFIRAREQDGSLGSTCTGTG